MMPVPRSAAARPARWRRRASALLALVLGLQVAADQPSLSRQIDRGRRLFHGEVELPARLAGHDIELPTMASRCSNCHEALDRPPTADGRPGDVTAIYAAPLTGRGLTTPQSRRGGPPSVFDAGRLCTLLRTGVDPAAIIVSTTMPRYAISDAQCEDLWVYLQRR